jgi:hypothetical protein
MERQEIYLVNLAKVIHLNQNNDKLLIPVFLDIRLQHAIILAILIMGKSLNIKDNSS